MGGERTKNERKLNRAKRSFAVLGILAGAGAQSVHYSSLPQCLCQPLICFLRRSRASRKPGEQDKSSKKALGEGLVPGPDVEEDEFGMEWIDETWEQYLLEVRTEIDITLEHRKQRVQKKDTPGALPLVLRENALSPDQQSSEQKPNKPSLGNPGPCTLSHLQTTSKGEIGEAGQQLSSRKSALSGELQQMSGYSNVSTATISLGEPVMSLAPASMEYISAWRPNMSSLSSPSRSEGVQQSSSYLELSAGRSKVRTDRVLARASPQQSSVSISQQTQHHNSIQAEKSSSAVTTRANVFNSEDTKNNSSLLSSSQGAPSRTAFLLPVACYTELSESQSTLTVMGRILGQKAQDWFTSHREITRAIAWFMLLLYFIVKFPAKPYIPTRVITPIEICVHLWFPLHFSSIANWSIVLSSGLKFDFVFMASEIVMFTSTGILMDYALYLYEMDKINLPTGGGSNADPGVLWYNFCSFCALWGSLGATFILCLLFCDGFTSKQRAVLRYMYAVVACFLPLYLGLLYFQVYKPHEAWTLSYLDLREGILFSSTVNLHQSTAGEGTRIRLFHFWINRGLNVSIFGIRTCMNVFRNPEDLIFIKSRMRMVHYPPKKPNEDKKHQSFFAFSLLRSTTAAIAPLNETKPSSV